jgi:magnesium transporter
MEKWFNATTFMTYLARQKYYLDKLEGLLAGDGEDAELGDFLNKLHPADIADLLEVLTQEQQKRAFGVLSTEQAARVMEEIDIAVKGKLILLESIGKEKAADIVEEMSDDERVDFLYEIPDEKTEEYFRIIDDSKEDEAKKLYHYPEDSAGGLMTLDYIAIPQSFTVNQALEFIRRKPPSSELVYYCYAIDHSGKLQGVVSTRDLISTPSDVLIEDIMISDLVVVETSTDQEEVAELCRRYDLLALPVVDENGVLRGMVTFDDVMEVIDQEATEDIYLQSAIVSPRESYLETPLARIWKSRVLWLIILLAAAVISGHVMKHYEAVSKGLIALTFFIPMLLGTAGNTGAQSATIVVRALALGQVRGRNRLALMGRELVTGVTLGATLGAIGFLFAFAVVPDAGWGLAWTLSLSLFLSIIVASMSGVGFPMVFETFGWDPALMSGPFLTTIVDVLGLLIYFGVASIFL